MVTGSVEDLVRGALAAARAYLPNLADDVREGVPYLRAENGSSSVELDVVGPVAIRLLSKVLSDNVPGVTVLCP